LVHATDIIKELLVYSAFFEGAFYAVPGGGYVRVWRYKETENPLFSLKTVFKIEKNKYDEMTATLYDYSAVLTTKITPENYKNFMNTFGVEWWNISDKKLTMEKVRDILKHNALAANAAPKIEQQLSSFQKIESMF